LISLLQKECNALAAEMLTITDYKGQYQFFSSD